MHIGLALSLIPKIIFLFIFLTDIAVKYTRNSGFYLFLSYDHYFMPKIAPKITKIDMSQKHTHKTSRVCQCAESVQYHDILNP